MRQCLTIVRPAPLGNALAAAIRDVIDRPLHVGPGHVRLLDARLAAGDFESVRTLLLRADPVPAMPLFLARYVRWAGDLHTAMAVWPTALAALETLLAHEGDAEDAWLARLTAAELGATATDLGDAPLAARLHREARTHDDDGRTPTGPRGTGEGDGAPDTIAGVAFDILGIEPDASRGRLHLRPALDRFEALEALGIRFGDASVSFRGAAGEDGIAIRVAQDSGSIPVTLLLEPFLPAAGAITIDGRPAELEARIIDGRTALSVQLVLDDERSLIVRGNDG